MALFTVVMLAATFALCLAWSRTRKKQENAGLPPGPRGLPLLGYLPFLRPDLHRLFAELADTYGPVASLRLGSKLCVVLSSPATAKEALVEKGAVFADRDVPAAVLASVFEGQDMVWSPYGPRWLTIRKVSVRELLNPSSIDGLRAVRRDAVRRMVEEVRGRAGERILVRELAAAAATRATMAMLWGSAAPEAGEDLRGQLQEAMESYIELGIEPNVSDFFPEVAWFDLQGVARRMRAVSARLDRLLDSIFEQQLAAAAEGENRNFLQVVVELLEEGDSQPPLTMMHIKGLILNLIGGSIETTASTVEWAMAELLQHPPKMKRAKEEIAAVAGKGGGAVEESHLPQLPYLDAVVKEALRLHPVAPLLVPRRTSAACTVGGYAIPAGATVFVNAWAIQRDPRLWEDASSFRPERFLGADGRAADYAGGSPSYLPFGAGRRVCVGVVLGERMVKLLLASLLRSSDWSVPEGAAPLDLSEQFGIVMKKKAALVAVPSALAHGVLFD